MTSRTTYYIVNAFTEQTFGGNPAAVMVLDDWLTNDQLLALAAQHNLSETAFVVERDHGVYGLRWFTPAAEVPLCGHATLAAAHVLRRELGVDSSWLQFETLHSGRLTASEQEEGIAIDLPAMAFEPHRIEPEVAAALNVEVLEAVRPVETPWQVIYRLAHERDVRALTPDIGRLARAVPHCVIVTAAGLEVDFVSRMFAPQYGVDEDPVTGSAHCLLTPFWAAFYGKSAFTAEQCSPRGGSLHCALEDERVILTGQAVTFAMGQITAPI